MIGSRIVSLLGYVAHLAVLNYYLLPTVAFAWNTPHRHHRIVLGQATERRLNNLSGHIINRRISESLSLALSSSSSSSDDNSSSDEAERLRSKAEELRNEVRKLEEVLGRSSNLSNDSSSKTTPSSSSSSPAMSLINKTVLVIGANGRLGSMICRHLLRNFPQTQVVAAVHYISEKSPTSRGYGRLSYEVGAEDGVGNIGAAWSSEQRTATFEYSDYMKDYNLQNLRLVEVELLDPVQCETVTRDVDCVIWAATDFNGNKPRAISGLNVAFLFRAVASPTKGRVEIEGLRNVLGGLKMSKVNERWREDVADGKQTTLSNTNNDPISFVHISAAPHAFDDFETPYGNFNALKREGELIVQKEFPTLSYCVLQMSQYDDNFVQEDLDIITQNVSSNDDEELSVNVKQTRRINRRDAARAAANALTDDTLLGKKVQLWTVAK